MRQAVAYEANGRPLAARAPQGATSRPFHTESRSADQVLVCIGGDADLGYAPAAGLPAGRRIAVDAWGRTADPRIFAGGDASSLGAGTVVGAMAMGRDGTARYVSDQALRARIVELEQKVKTAKDG